VSAASAVLSAIAGPRVACPALAAGLGRETPPTVAQPGYDRARGWCLHLGQAAADGSCCGCRHCASPVFADSMNSSMAVSSWSHRISAFAVSKGTRFSMPPRKVGAKVFTRGFQPGPHGRARGSGTGQCKLWPCRRWLSRACVHWGSRRARRRLPGSRRQPGWRPD
jgi:hypothetical protein